MVKAASLRGDRPAAAAACACRRQEPLGLERRDAAGSGRGDRLPPMLVLHVAGREHAGHRGLRLARPGHARSPRRPARPGRGTRSCSACGRSRRTRRPRPACSARPVRTLRSRSPVTTSGCPAPTTSSTALSQTTSIFGCANSRRCRIFSARRQSRRCTSVTLLGVVGQVERLLDRGVAAADHRNPLAAVEEPVAGRAGRDAGALQPLLRRQAEPARLRAGGDHHRVGQVDVTGIAGARGTAGARNRPPWPGRG